MHWCFPLLTATSVVCSSSSLFSITYYHVPACRGMAYPVYPYKLVNSESISILPIIGSVHIKVSPLNWNFSTYNYVCESLFYFRYLFNIVYMRAVNVLYACKKLCYRVKKKKYNPISIFEQ